MKKHVILVLGGGGVKGLAHIGAWKALEEAGLSGAVTEIVGTSIGALVGACLASGQGWSDLAPQALALRQRDIASLNGRALLINGIRQRSLFHGERLAEYVRSVAPGGWEELKIPLQMNAVDLETGATEWFGAGGRTDVSLAEAIYASCALPVFYPPAEIGGRHYVDGGVRDTLPISRARARGAELVIAVDVAAGEQKDALDVVSKGMVAIQHRVFDIMSYQYRENCLDRWADCPMVYVRPKLEGTSTFDFERAGYFLEEGYRATRQALAAWRSATAAD